MSPTEVLSMADIEVMVISELLRFLDIRLAIFDSFSDRISDLFEHANFLGWIICICRLLRQLLLLRKIHFLYLFHEDFNQLRIRLI